MTTLLLNKEEANEILTELQDYYDEPSDLKSECKRYAQEFTLKTGRVATTHDIATEMVTAGCFACDYDDQAKYLIQWGFDNYRTIKQWQAEKDNGELVMKLYIIAVGEALEVLFEGV